MKHLCLIIACLSLALHTRAQDDTLYYEEDTNLVLLPPIRFHLQTFSAVWMDGRVQFFDGYNHEMLYADASTGLPLYSDWHLYSSSSLLPSYFQVGLQAGLTDSVRGLRLRLGLHYAARRDSMAYSGGFLTTDTTLGRLGSEQGAFAGLSVAGMKQSRTLFKCLRLHGGAELEVGISPQSRIMLLEYAYDVGDQELLDYNEFSARGKPRMDVFLNAILGMEMVFWKHIGFMAEVRSGLGAQIVVKEQAFGMARTAYMVGLQYYLWDYDRRPLPQMPHVIEEEPSTPLPEF